MAYGKDTFRIAAVEERFADELNAGCPVKVIEKNQVREVFYILQTRDIFVIEHDFADGIIEYALNGRVILYGVLGADYAYGMIDYVLALPFRKFFIVIVGKLPRLIPFTV